VKVRPVAIALTPSEQALLIRIVREFIAREDSLAAVDLLQMLENALDARAVPALAPETMPDKVEGLV
jgi:hypothetical protein